MGGRSTNLQNYASVSLRPRGRELALLDYLFFKDCALTALYDVKYYMMIQETRLYTKYEATSVLSQLNSNIRIVHLDLKGAPLKLVYLEKVVTTIKLWGVTGILLEWEDTFPYTGDLNAVGSLSNAGGDSMYNLSEVYHIINFIKEMNMDPIQLVQTIGHMEFVLKHPPFHELREIPTSPAVLCPCNPKSQELVRQMIDQTLEVQPDAKFFHIGADEAWHLGICPMCQLKALNHKYKANALFLDHIKYVVLYIKLKRPHITVLMWDDMLRNVDFETLQDYDLGPYVIPVVWNYSHQEVFSIQPELMDLYGALFPKAFFGTAFKGANGSCTVLSPALRYVSNHKAWVEQVSHNNRRINFTGVILTGWSRYDHYATLCELMPSALPSLAACLRVLNKAQHLCIDSENIVDEILPSEEWPGEAVARCVHSFGCARERSLSLLSSDQVNTWLNPWQISRRYTVPGHLEGILVTAQDCLNELLVIKANMNTFLQEITGERSTEEWVKTYIEPLIAKMSKLSEQARERYNCEASVRPVAPD